VTPRIAVVLAVALLPSCGVAAHSAAAPNLAPQQPASLSTAARFEPLETERNPSNDYVVGPFVEGEAGVRTYYIVRN
jgi:hypothetical protein